MKGRRPGLRVRGRSGQEYLVDHVNHAVAGVDVHEMMLVMLLLNMT
jgi:hypothetical protein